MIPILYGPNEREFKTNGLGRLSDAISCSITQERNGQYDLEMEYPTTGIHYSDLAHENIILAKPEDGASSQPFEIYDISEPINGVVTVLARHISYRLKELTVMPFTAESAPEAMRAIQAHIVGDHPFTFDTDKDTIAKMSVDVPVACRSILGGVTGSVLDCYGGGEYEFDRFAVHLWKARGRDRGVIIRYGKNLTDSERESNIDGVYTSVVPYWKGTDDEQNEITVIGDRVDSEHVGDYSCQKCVPLDLSGEWQTAPTKEQLEARAAQYMENNATWQPSVSVQISFIPLSKTLEYADIKSVEHVRLCDIVTVECRGYTVKAKVIKTVYDALREVYESVELGDAKASFGQTVNRDTVTPAEVDSKVRSVVQQASDKLSDMIAKASGLYCTEQIQPDGSTIYLLHDKPTLTESRNVIKLTSEAIGFSTDGGDTYPYGFTITGEMVAKILSTDGINANWINAGILQSFADESGNRAFFLDLENGILRMNAQELTITGKTVEDIADSAVDSYDDTLTQTEVFNRLTGGGVAQGLFIKDGQLYINATYLSTGVLKSKDGETFYLDLDKGILNMKASSLSISGQSVQQIAQGCADSAVDSYDDTLTQTEVFNRLTGGNSAQGIYLSGGKLYINASYINAGKIDLRQLSVEGSVGGIKQGNGMDGSGAITTGIVIYGPNGFDSSGRAIPPYIILTGGGFRVQITDSVSFYITGNMVVNTGLRVNGNIRATGVLRSDTSAWLGRDLVSNSPGVNVHTSEDGGINLCGYSRSSGAVWVGNGGGNLPLVLHGNDITSDVSIRTTSDRNAKKDIEPLERDTAGAMSDTGMEAPSIDGEPTAVSDLSAKYEALIDGMRPVRFRYKAEAETEPYHIGYIAQDVEAALTAAGLSAVDFGAVKEGVDEKGNKSLGLAYEEIIALLHLKIRRQEEQLKAQDERIKALERAVFK